MARDWLKLHRSIVDTAFWHDDWLVRLWIWCLVKANYTDAKWRGLPIARGEFITGRNTAADELGVSPSKWLRGIMRLVDLGCLRYEADSNWTRLTVCNYVTYQDDSRKERTASGQQMDNERTSGDTTSGQPADTSKNVIREEGNKERINTPPNPQGGSAGVETNGRHRKPRTPKLDATYSSDFETFWNSFPPIRKGNKPDAWKAWQQVSQGIDPQTIITAAIDFALSPMGLGEYCPGPAPWLRGRRWEDDRRSWQGAKRLAEQLTPKGPSY